MRRSARSICACAASLERVGGADDDAQLAARDAREQVGERLVDHRRAPEAVHEPEADDRAERAHAARRCAPRSARARRSRRSTRRPNGASAASDASKTCAAGHLEDDVDAAGRRWPRRRRSVRPSGVGVDRGVGAELERERALLLGRGGGDHAPGAHRPGRAGRPASRRRPRRRATTTVSPGRSARRAVQVPGGQALEQQRQRGAVVDAVGDREGQRRRARSRTRRSRRCRTARRRARRCPRARPRPRRPGTSGSSCRGEVGVRGAGGCRRSSCPRA